MRRHVFAITLAVLLVAGLSAPAIAGFVEDSCQVVFQDDPNCEKHSYSFDYANDKLTLHEGSITRMGSDPPLTCTGDIDEDPILWIYEDVLNETGVTWTGWLLELDPNGTATFPDPNTYTPTSDTFNSHTLVNSKTLRFDSPDSVDPNDSVELSFYVNIPYTGPGIESFSFTLTQTPIPEPAALSVLALGGGMLMWRRRRR